MEEVTENLGSKRKRKLQDEMICPVTLSAFLKVSEVNLKHARNDGPPLRRPFW